MNKRFRLLALSISVFIGFSMSLAACGTSGVTTESTAPAETAATSNSSNPYGTNTIDPAPANEPILTVVNGSNSVDYTLKDLQGFGTSDISIFEPFLKKRQTFTVIPLFEIFSKNGIGESAEIETVALNDYSYSDTATNFTANSGYLAIALEGKDIPYDRGGPIRIIFPDKSEWAGYLDAWNWAIREFIVM